MGKSTGQSYTASHKTYHLCIDVEQWDEHIPLLCLDYSEAV